MKKALKPVLMLVALVLTLAGIARVWLWYGYYTERKQAAELVERIETFETSHETLPASLVELGLQDKDEGRGPFYQREGEHHYIIWFGETLGTSYVFDSQTRKWQLAG